MMDKKALKRITIGAMLLSNMMYLPSCETEEYDFSNMEKELMVTETAIDAPIGSVSFSLLDIFKQENARGFIKTLEERIDVHNIDIDPELLFPIIAQHVDVSSLDTIKHVSFTEATGVIDSLEYANLKLTIENQLPINSELTIMFLTRKKNETEGGKDIIEELTSLTKTIDIMQSRIDPQTKHLAFPYQDKINIKFSGDDCEQIKKITDIVISYRIRTEENSTFYIAKEYTFNVSMSLYMKAKLLFDLQ